MFPLVLAQYPAKPSQVVPAGHTSLSVRFRAGLTELRYYGGRYTPTPLSISWGVIPEENMKSRTRCMNTSYPMCLLEAISIMFIMAEMEQV